MGVAMGAVFLGVDLGVAFEAVFPGVALGVALAVTCLGVAFLTGAFGRVRDALPPARVGRVAGAFTRLLPARFAVFPCRAMVLPGSLSPHIIPSLKRRPNGASRSRSTSLYRSARGP